MRMTLVIPGFVSAMFLNRFTFSCLKLNYNHFKLGSFVAFK
jgi:hypothetical protein